MIAWLDEVRNLGDETFTVEWVRALTERVRRLGPPRSPDGQDMDGKELQLGSGELSDLFAASWKLHKASNAPCEGVHIRAPMSIWWAGTARSEHASVFIGWMKSDTFTERVLSENHAGIIRSEILLRDIISIS